MSLKTLDEILCRAEIEVGKTIVGIVCVEESVLSAMLRVVEFAMVVAELHVCWDAR